jgi:hypothetical protein
MRLREMQGGIERLDRELRQELALGRQEAATVARGDREEQSQSLAAWRRHSPRSWGSSASCRRSSSNPLPSNCRA